MTKREKVVTWTPLQTLTGQRPFQGKPLLHSQGGQLSYASKMRLPSGTESHSVMWRTELAPLSWPRGSETVTLSLLRARMARALLAAAREDLVSFLLFPWLPKHLCDAIWVRTSSSEDLPGGLSLNSSRDAAPYVTLPQADGGCTRYQIPAESCFTKPRRRPRNFSQSSPSSWGTLTLVTLPVNPRGTRCWPPELPGQKKRLDGAASLHQLTTCCKPALTGPEPERQLAGVTGQVTEPEHCQASMACVGSQLRLLRSPHPAPAVNPGNREVSRYRAMVMNGASEPNCGAGIHKPP